jgi:lambda family phage tail tape measure protein
MSAIENFKVKITTEGTDQLDRIARGAENASNKMNMLAGAILGVSFVSFVKGAIDMADRITDLSDATGIAVGSIKGFEDALSAAGGKAKNAEKIIMTFYQSMDNALQGSDKTREAFQKLGISIDDLKNKSEADLLGRALTQLAGMEEGSTRTALATDLFGRSIRAVDLNKFLQELKDGKKSAFEAAKDLEAAGEAADRMDKAFRTLQEGALKAFGPIIKHLGDAKTGADDAATGFKVLAGVMALAFGAQILANIISINTALGITAGLSNVIGKGPLGVIAKLGALGVGAVTIANIEDLIKKNEELKDSADKAVAAQTGAGQTGAVIEGKKTDNKPANRPAGISPKDQALIDSNKRITQSIAEQRKYAEMVTNDDIFNIRRSAQADIEKMEAEVRGNKLLGDTQKEKEIAQRRLEINAKADQDIAKIRADNERQMNQSIQSFAFSNTERDKAIQLELEMAKLTALDAEERRNILDLEKQRNQILEEFRRTRNVTAEELAIKEAQLNAEMMRGVELIKQQTQERRNQQNDQTAGAVKRMNDIADSLTPFKVGGMMVDSVFNNMTSALDKFVETGKFKFSDFAASVIRNLLMIQLRASATSLFNSVGGGAGVMNFLSSIFKAGGGPVSANSPYIVGERGPELFVPKVSGSIIPNNKMTGQGASLGGSPTYITNNISAIDSKSVAQLFAENRTILFGNVEQARREMPMRTR